MKAVFLRFFALLVSSVMLLFSGVSQTAEYDVRDPEACLLNFSVLSDSHIEVTNPTRYKVFSYCLQDVKKNLRGNDAVVFLGDNTMNGQTMEHLLFNGAVRTILKNETVLPVMGNHDIGNGEGDYEKLQTRWYDFTAAFFGKKLTHPYYSQVIEGYTFIVLGTEAQTVHELVMSDAQYSWLEGVLEEAAGSGKPVFVFCHFPSDYAETETGKYDERLMDLLAEYNETNDLFYFCGHTHMPLYLYWSFHSSDGYPEIYLPRLTELGGSDDDEIFRNTGIGMEVEIYENEVLVRGRDFYRGEWRIDDEETGELCEMTYTLKNPIG